MVTRDPGYSFRKAASAGVVRIKSPSRLSCTIRIDFMRISPQSNYAPSPPLTTSARATKGTEERRKPTANGREDKRQIQPVLLVPYARSSLVGRFGAALTFGRASPDQ